MRLRLAEILLLIFTGEAFSRELGPSNSDMSRLTFAPTVDSKIIDQNTATYYTMLPGSRPPPGQPGIPAKLTLPLSYATSDTYIGAIFYQIGVSSLSTDRPNQVKFSVISA